MLAVLRGKTGLGLSLAFVIMTSAGLAAAQTATPPAASPSAPPAPATPPSTAPGTPSTPGAPAPSGYPAPLADSLTGVAKAEYEAGRVLYADGDFAGAALKFQRAYDESKDPRLLWNMMVAEKGLRRYARVADLIELYLVESGPRITPEERSEAEILLATIKTFVGSVQFHVTPPGATVYVDDVAVGVSPFPTPVRMEQGQHRIRVQKPGFRDHNATETIQGGIPAALSITLQEDLHEGKLRILAGPGDIIRIDGAQVGSNEWAGVLKSGVHTISVTGQGKRPYQSDVAVKDNQDQLLRVVLDPVPASPAAPMKEAGIPTWMWVAGGGVLAAGLGVGAYFAFKPDDKIPVQGSLDTVELEMRGVRF